MSQNFGGERPRPPIQTEHRPPSRFLVLIDSGGSTVARLFLASRQQVAEFDAAVEEITQMTAGLLPSRSGHEPVWDQALAGHSAEERLAAEVYTLDV